MRKVLPESFFKLSIKEKTNRALLALASLLFFFAIFDTLLSYALPILLTAHGFSETQLGLIIGSSSFFGAIIDIFVSRFVKNTDFRKMFLLMIAGMALYFGVLFASETIVMFLFSMALWALYWNFLSYGLYNFVGSTPETEHATNWGILDIFKGLGLIVAPIIASVALKEGVTPLIFGVSLVFLFLVYVFYTLLVKVSDTPKKLSIKTIDRVDYRKFLKVTRIIFPILLMDILLAIFDMSFSTIGPLISESLKGPHALGGLFLTLYYLPTVIMLWLAGPITKRFGKKRTAFIGFSIGAIGIGTFALFGKGVILLPLVFVTSMISSLAWPAIKGCFADYITRYPKYEREIEILTSFFGNIGCIIGPVIAGFLAQHMGDIEALSAIGVVCGVITLVVWRTTPRKIRII